MFPRFLATLIVMTLIWPIAPTVAEDFDRIGPPPEPINQEMNTIEKVDTVGGLLTLDEFDGWGFLHLKGYTVDRGDASHIRIVSTVPKSGKAEFVIYYIWNGGNCCEPDYFLLDAGATPPRTLTITNWNAGAPTVAQYKPGIMTLRRLAETPTLHGDTIWEIIRYKRGEEDFEVIRRSIINNYMKFVSRPPSKFLSDATARYSLVELLGVEGFGKFREFDADGENTTLVSNRYLLGSISARGRDTPWEYRVFVIDTYLDRAWAIQRDEEIESSNSAIITAWGTLDEKDTVVRRLLNDWLRQFGKETVWKSGPIEIGNASLMPAPPPPTWHPRLPDTMQPY